MRFFYLLIYIIFLVSGCSLLSHKIEIKAKAKDKIVSTPAPIIIEETYKEVPKQPIQQPVQVVHEAPIIIQQPTRVVSKTPTQSPVPVQVVQIQEAPIIQQPTRVVRKMPIQPVQVVHEAPIKVVSKKIPISNIEEPHRNRLSIKHNRKRRNKKLNKLMRKFDDLIFTQINNEVEEGEEDMFLDKYIQAELKSYIKDIDKIETLYPNPDNNYKLLVKKLKRESIKLYKIIKIKKTEWVEPQIENVISVCNQCHDLYQN